MSRAIMALIILSLLGCSPGGEGTSTGNPLVDVRIDSYNSTAVAQKTEFQTMALMSSLKFCFKRVRFKLDGETTNPDPTQDSDNVDFYLGEVNISSLGTTLKSISIPHGTYKRVEFDLEDDCSSGKSIQLTNSQGNFSTDDRITITFEGTFVHDGTGDILNLAIQDVVSALNTVNDSSQIKTKAESVNGDF
ncbi:hypothetical protein [Bdellovibrio sp. HCB337]|uniref:hypothetical protein n=1 Tax=Bdellovibrio sp. HCB337 TaxID=3394358 RepID=UPI0039A4FC08